MKVQTSLIKNGMSIDYKGKLFQDYILKLDVFVITKKAIEEIEIEIKKS